MVTEGDRIYIFVVNSSLKSCDDIIVFFLCAELAAKSEDTRGQLRHLNQEVHLHFLKRVIRQMEIDSMTCNCFF